jgi:hypothetical protein
MNCEFVDAVKKLKAIELFGKLNGWTRSEGISVAAKRPYASCASSSSRRGAQSETSPAAAACRCARARGTTPPPRGSASVYQSTH